MKIMVTGHRPPKVGGYGPSPTQDWIREQLRDVLSRAKTKHPNIEVISGMALGVDQWWAEIGLSMGCKVKGYVPFLKQHHAWPKESQEHYLSILQKIGRENIVLCSEGDYSAIKMQIRNERMVDDADFCVAVWDGSSGGTGNCVRYIKTAGKPMYWINPKTHECQWVMPKKEF